MHPLYPLLLFAISTSVTPGPNNIMLLSSGLNYGTRRTLPHCLGIAIGFPVMAIIVALGFGVIFQKYYWIKESLKIIGSLYMLYLAWKIASSTQSVKAKKPTVKKPLSFMQAAMFQWVNPKAWLMAIGVVSIFTFSHNALVNALGIGTVYLVVCSCTTTTWAALGHYLQKWLSNDRRRHCFNIIMALLLVLSIVLIFIEK